MKPGDDVLPIDKWCWSIGSWCKKLSLVLVSARFARGSYYMPAVVRKCLLVMSYRVAARALKHTATLPGATVAAHTLSSMTDRVCELCTFIAEHDLSFTIS